MILDEMEIPQHLINLIKNLYASQAKVKIGRTIKILQHAKRNATGMYLEFLIIQHL